MTKITKELVEASLIPALTNQGWQQLIEVTKNIKITPESISVDYLNLSKLRAIYEWLNEKEDDANKDDKEKIATRKAAFDSLRKPIKEILNNAEPDFISINNEILKRERQIGGAIDSENNLRIEFIEFVNLTTKNITLAEGSKELGIIQMKIGNLKSRSKIYGDYKDKVDSVCDRLISLIDDRKVFLKQNVKLEASYKKAIDSGDIVLATQIRGEIDNHKRVLEQNANNLAQDAYDEVASVAIMNNDMVSAAINPRLHRWSWRVDDIEKLFKKRPELVEKVPNTKAINVFMSEKKEAKELDPDMDNEFSGLVIWNKPFYVSVSK